MRFLMKAAGSLVASLIVCQSAFAQDDFYKGKLVTIINPFGLAGVYGIYGQLVTAHLPRHIPGQPTIILQGMPGAGGVNAMRYVANIAPKDGTVLVMPIATLAQQDILDSNVSIGGDRFQFIGRLEAVEQVGVVWRKSGVQSVEDAKTKALHAGGVGIASATALNARLLNVLAGTKFRIISSYKSMGDIIGAFERGEVDLLTATWEIIRDRFPNQLKEGEIVAIYTFSHAPIGGLETIPHIASFASTPQQKTFMEVYSVVTQIGRSLAVAEGVPADRVEILRGAFDRMLVDPEFLASVKKANIRLNPLTGQEIQAIVRKVYQLPTQQLESAREFYKQLLAGAR